MKLNVWVQEKRSGYLECSTLLSSVFVCVICGWAPSPLSPSRDELGGGDQAPEDVLERLAAVANGVDVAAAGLHFFGSRVAGEDAEVEIVERHAVVGRGGQDVAKDRPGPRFH